jgi:phosphatidylserine/phosphatidylglycerophosphate/cardiolipin synthase-like enzyme
VSHADAELEGTVVPSAGATAGALQAAALTLPAQQISRLAVALEAQPGPDDTARRAAWSVVANARFRQHVAAIFAAWAVECPQISGRSLALALRTAHSTAAHLRAQVDVDIAWTGPASYLVPVRRTREVLFEVIGAAQASLILVSFAAYKVPAVIERLEQAAARGVDIRLVLETKEDSHGALSVDAAAAFTALSGLVTFYVWPADLRPETPSGKVALHAKAALADDHIAFVTSANLTGAAQTDNIELGLVVTGGPVPERLAAHFRTLMSQDVLRPVDH